MPEGDTIHRAANRIRPVLEGRVPDRLTMPRNDRWAQRLAGRPVTGVDAHGKHLFIHFDGQLVIHSHLRMTGAWTIGRVGDRWRRARRRAWLVIQAGAGEVVQFDGPVLELLTESRRRFDSRLAALGPDVLGETLDQGEVLRRLRDDDPTRSIGDALLDQRTIAGLGTIWRAESCFAAGVNPWRPTGGVTDREVLAIVGSARDQMTAAVRAGERPGRRAVYGLDGRPCRRCGTRIRRASLGDDARVVYWCPSCQQ